MASKVIQPGEGTSDVSRRGSLSRWGQPRPHCSFGLPPHVPARPSGHNHKG